MEMGREFFKRHYAQLSALLNCIKVGVYITDREGRTIFLNDESCKTGGLAREEIIGKSIYELERKGFIEDSVTARILKSKKEESMIQHLGDGGKLFVTGVPLCGQDNIELVISTERDITETLSLKALLAEQDKKSEKYEQEIAYLQRQNIELWGDLIAEDELTKQIANQAMRVAKLDATTVLLTGETGTGKEVYANVIYQNSPRVGKSFIKVNCAAIPENLLESEMFGYVSGAFTGADKRGKMGLFEMANGGTIFLDEVAELPVHLQSKLLRVLQEKEILRVGATKPIPLDIRIIAATNKNLNKEIQQGTFREDLYYRLNIMPIELPPLRGRERDIAALSDFFVKKFNKDYKLKKFILPEAMELLKKYSWPGNIRELENIIERLMISFDGDRITRFQADAVFGKSIGLEDQQPTVEAQEHTFDQLMEEYERTLLVQMLERYEKPCIMATKLGMHKSTLSRKMKKYGI